MDDKKVVLVTMVTIQAGLKCLISEKSTKEMIAEIILGLFVQAGISKSISFRYL